LSKNVNLFDPATGEKVMVATVRDGRNRHIGQPRVVDHALLTILGRTGGKIGFLFWLMEGSTTLNFIPKSYIKLSHIHRNTVNSYLHILCDEGFIRSAKLVTVRGVYNGYMINPRLFRKGINLDRQLDMIDDWDKEVCIILGSREKIDDKRS
jgi:hypothetical protein